MRRHGASVDSEPGRSDAGTGAGRGRGRSGSGAGTSTPISCSSSRWRDDVMAGPTEDTSHRAG